jgi:hypothetical protein
MPFFYRLLNGDATTTTTTTTTSTTSTTSTTTTTTTTTPAPYFGDLSEGYYCIGSPTDVEGSCHEPQCGYHSGGPFYTYCNTVNGPYSTLEECEVNCGTTTSTTSTSTTSTSTTLSPTTSSPTSTTFPP